MNTPPPEPTGNAAINTLADRIDALLPQTQCQRCGYPACKPYAEAIARGEAGINQCPPGGAQGIHRLAALLGREYVPLSPQFGVEMGRQVVVIDESLCIGCTLCIKACPVDAIVGASKRMHTVIRDHCTGCELCIPPCPVDCIDIVQLAPPAAAGPEAVSSNPAMNAEQQAAADSARGRYDFHCHRLARDERERTERLAAKILAQPAHHPNEDAKQALIAAALERVRAKQAQQTQAQTQAEQVTAKKIGQTNADNAPGD